MDLALLPLPFPSIRQDMKRIVRSVVLVACLWVLLPGPCPAHALEMTVSASSSLLNLFDHFGPENLLDNDPATAWAEGVRGTGVGEWALFEFGGPVQVQRLGVRSGWQADGEFLANARPAKLRLEFSDGYAVDMPLPDAPDWQYLEVTHSAAWVRLVILDVYPGTGRADRTCISDVAFEVALLNPADAAAVQERAVPAAEVDPELAAEALEAESQTKEPTPRVTEKRPGSASAKQRITLVDLFTEELPVLPSVDVAAMSGQGRSETKGEAPAAVTGGSSLAPVPENGSEVGEGPAPDASLDAVEPAADAPGTEARVAGQGRSAYSRIIGQQPDSEQKSWGELPEVDVAAMAGEREAKGGKVAGPVDQQAVRKVIRAYYTKLVTLDDGYVELYARNVRDEESFMFEYFKELQRQRRVFHLFRKALVDTEALQFGPALVDGEFIRLEVQGRYTIYVADTYEDMPVHTRFTFIREHGGWKVLKAEDLEVSEGEAAQK